jgi:serine/threonine-protein kinase
MQKRETSISLPFSLLDNEIGPYHIEAALGAGNMGTVYRVKSPSGQHFALKIMKWRESSGGESYQRFMREIELLKKLRHPNIVQIYDAGECRGCPYFVIDYLEGTTLERYIEAKKRLPAKEALQIVWKIALALEAVHRVGVLHRDIKPSNIFLVNKKPYLMDFGVSSHYTCASHLTRPGSIIGTPNYMALEQAQGDINKMGPWSDVYALGVTLYQALSGVLPFKGKSHLDVLINLQEKEARPLRKQSPWINEETSQVVHKAMHKDYHQRYQTAEEFAGALRLLLHEKKATLATTLVSKLPPVRTSWAIYMVLVFCCITAGLGIAMFTNSRNVKPNLRPQPDKSTPGNKPHNTVAQNIGQTGKQEPGKPQAGKKPQATQADHRPPTQLLQPAKPPHSTRVAGLHFPSPEDLVLSGNMPDVEQRLAVLSRTIEQARNGKNENMLQKLYGDVADLFHTLCNYERELFYRKQMVPKDRMLWERMCEISQRLGMYAHAKYYQERLQANVPEREDLGIPISLPPHRQELRRLLRTLCCVKLAVEERQFQIAEHYVQQAKELTTSPTLVEFGPYVQALYVMLHVRDSDKDKWLQELRQVYRFPQKTPMFPICSVYVHQLSQETFYWIGPELFLLEGIYYFFADAHAKAQDRFDLIAQNYALYASATNSPNDGLLAIAREYIQALKGNQTQRASLYREEQKMCDVSQFLYILVSRILTQSKFLLQASLVTPAEVQNVWEDMGSAEMNWHHLFQIHLATIFYKPAGRWQLAIDHAWRARQAHCHDDYTEPIFLLAQIADETGYRDEARLYFRYCLEHLPAWSGDKQKIKNFIQQKLAE